MSILQADTTSVSYNNYQQSNDQDPGEASEERRDLSKDIEAASDDVGNLPNHKDFMGRYYWIEEQEDNSRDRFLKPRDGRLALLKVQTWGGDKFPNQRTSWDRIGFQDTTPLMIKWVYWIMESVPRLHKASNTESVRRRHQYHNAPNAINPHPRSFKEWCKEYLSKQWLTVYARWIPGCLVLLFLLAVPATLDGEIRNNGFYDPVRYRDWRYPETARNHREDRPPEKGRTDHTGEPLANNRSKIAAPNQIPDSVWDKDFDGSPARHLRPRFLCVLKDHISVPSSYKQSPLVQRFNQRRPKNAGFEIVSVEDWVNAHDGHAHLDYVFVSYTRRQFQTYSPAEISGWSPPNSQDETKKKQELHKRKEMSNLYTEDLLHLCQQGIRAAQEAEVPAFWIDVLCVDPTTFAQDIYRICDVVRGAHSMIIALKNSVDNRVMLQGPSSNRDKLLKEWGGRLWTLPEILLCPNTHGIAIHIHGSVAAPECFTKRSLASLAYYPRDAKTVRQLIDHYEGTLILTSLELVTIGLECLQSRMGNTKHFADGDLAYALMGLLCRRPAVVKGESAFEAFAKLSLANDSNMLLERLICVLPSVKGRPWYKIKDAWKVKLWDIYPTCQIAGIGAGQTVILDGAYGASIRWKSLKPVAFIRRKTGFRFAIKLLLRGAPLYFITGVAMLASSTRARVPSHAQPTNPVEVIGILFFVFATIIILLSPYLLLATYRGKFWSTQGWFFGIEGEPDLATIEKSLFGVDLGRLSWSINSSMLSRHQVAKKKRNRPILDGECEALEPAAQEPPQSDESENEEHEQPVKAPQDPDQQQPAVQEQERVFTLVDTYTMTVTRFRAVRPPVAVLICGREGGMQRAVLCSYNWRTQTFHRETVLRMKTMVLERMFRVDKFRFSMNGINTAKAD